MENTIKFHSKSYKGAQIKRPVPINKAQDDKVLAVKADLCAPKDMHHKVNKREAVPRASCSDTFRSYSSAALASSKGKSLTIGTTEYMIGTALKEKMESF